MNVLMINGSPDKKGSTYTALSVIAEVLKAEGIGSEIVQTGNAAVRDCIGCGRCDTLVNRCTFDDDCVNRLLEKAEAADGFVFGTPVYYAHPSGRILSILDRMFYAGSEVLAHKPAFAVAAARRAGTVASVDVLNKYFTINQMPVVSSTYWTEIHGAGAADVEKDEEGVLTMKHAALNMAWLLKCIDAGRKAGILPPENKKNVWTNFVR